MIVTATGEIDQLTESLLESTVSQALSESTNQLVITDLTAVEFLSSAGVRALTIAMQQARLTQRPLRLVVGHQRPVLTPLELTGLDEVLALYETVEDAIVDLPR